VNRTLNLAMKLDSLPNNAIQRTYGSGQIETSIDSSIARHHPAGSFDSRLFGVVFRFMVGAEWNGTSLATQDAAGISRVRHEQLVTSQNGHDGRAAAVRTRLSITETLITKFTIKHNKTFDNLK
jgi:hypothetical protein